MQNISYSFDPRLYFFRISNTALSKLESSLATVYYVAAGMVDHICGCHYVLN